MYMYSRSSAGTGGGEKPRAARPVAFVVAAARQATFEEEQVAPLALWDDVSESNALL